MHVLMRLVNTNVSNKHKCAFVYTLTRIVFITYTRSGTLLDNTFVTRMQYSIAISAHVLNAIYCEWASICHRMIMYISYAKNISGIPCEYVFCAPCEYVSCGTCTAVSFDMVMLYMLASYSILWIG
jgi:hypothetical protein